MGYDIVRTAGALLMAIGTWRARMMPEPRDEPAARPPLRSLGFAIVPLLVPPAILATDLALGQEPKTLAVLVGMLALVAIAFVRTTRLLRSESQARAEAAAARDVALDV